MSPQLEIFIKALSRYVLRTSATALAREIAPLFLTGGILSLIQLFLDSSFLDDWSGITGNPIKFLLSNVSILFDILFMVQHYILYRGADDPVTKHQDPDVTTPLLSESNGAPRTEDV
ncbi:hypothetical protein APSETT444_001171 [Aspergillus pseudonomiae]